MVNNILIRVGYCKPSATKMNKFIAFDSDRFTFDSDFESCPALKDAIVLFYERVKSGNSVLALIRKDFVEIGNLVF